MGNPLRYLVINKHAPIMEAKAQTGLLSSLLSSFLIRQAVGLKTSRTNSSFEVPEVAGSSGEQHTMMSHHQALVNQQMTRPLQPGPRR
jgi:hypothetical protein